MFVIIFTLQIKESTERGGELCNGAHTCASEKYYPLLQWCPLKTFYDQVTFHVMWQDCNQTQNPWNGWLMLSPTKLSTIYIINIILELKKQGCSPQGTTSYCKIIFICWTLNFVFFRGYSNKKIPVSANMSIVVKQQKFVPKKVNDFSDLMETEPDTYWIRKFLMWATHCEHCPVKDKKQLHLIIHKTSHQQVLQILSKVAYSISVSTDCSNDV